MIKKTSVMYTPAQKERGLHIYLPDDYDCSEERYPVMYFFDGHNLFNDQDATYGKSWGMNEFLQNWNKKMILVGIECGHEGNERLSEYLPYSVKSGEFSKYEALGEETFQWILQELKPMIDRDYRTIPFRECTGIGGSSMGGLMALYGVVRHNSWFSKAACVSSAVRFCRNPLLKDLKECEMSPDTRVFLSWGTCEGPDMPENPEQEDRTSYTYRTLKSVSNKIQEMGADVEMFCQVGGRHCEADWEKQVPMFMNYLWN